MQSDLQAYQHELEDSAETEDVELSKRIYIPSWTNTFPPNAPSWQDTETMGKQAGQEPSQGTDAV